jgi:hypothetical protein
LRGREGFGIPISLPSSLRGRIQHFCESETSFFHCARGKVSEVKGPSDAAPDASSRVTGHVRWLTLGAAQLGGCTSVSDGLASDTG